MKTFQENPVSIMLMNSPGFVAACDTLGLIVDSQFTKNSLRVRSMELTFFGWPVQDYTIERSWFDFGSPYASMCFNRSGYLAFMGPPSRRLLLVTDVGRSAVHIIDVVGKTHEGYVAPPGTLRGPRGVAAKDNLVAISAFDRGLEGHHMVWVFEKRGDVWLTLRKVAADFEGPGNADGQLWCPYGLRFTADGMGLVVADSYNNRVSMFCVEDGSFVRHIAMRSYGAVDVEEWEGGWLVACTKSVEFVPQYPIVGVSRHTLDIRLGLCCSLGSLAFTPMQGLLVADTANKRVYNFNTPDGIAMKSMSDVRVGWMVAVARGIEARRRRAGVVRAEESGGKRPLV
jgi:hypothetical protein